MTDKKAYHEEDLTEADRRVLRLYEQAQEPIAWDASDDAVLAFARDAKVGPKARRGAETAETTVLAGRGDTAGGTLGRTSMDDLLSEEPEGTPEQDGPKQDDPNQDDKVVSFATRRQAKKQPANLTRRAMNSPVIGFAIAASLVIGVFIGQGLDGFLIPGGDTDTPIYRNVPSTPVVIPSGLGEPQGLDVVAEKIAELTCADVSMAVLPGNDLELKGFVASAGDLADIRGLLAGLPKQYQDIRSDISVRPWPFCEALNLLNSHAGGGRSGSEAPIIRPLRHAVDYKNGESIVLEASAAAGTGGYLTVDYLQRDGTVIHMLPTFVSPNHQADANGRLIIGEGARKYLAGEPYGTDLVILIQTPEPLFDQPRPEIEPAESYLATLKARLEQTPENTVSSAYTFLTSHPSE